VLAIDAAYCPRCGAATGTTVVEDRERTYCPDCDRVLWRNAVPVMNVRVADGDRVLLVERGIDPYEGRWCLPGGHAEFDEQPHNAAARELHEETNLRVAPDALAVGDAALETFDDHTRVAITYAVDRAATAGVPSAGTDAVDAAFRRPDDVAEDELVPSHWGVIDRLG